MKPKVLISGPRDFQNEGFVHAALNDNLGTDSDLIIITGGANGVDTFAMNWAKKNEYEIETYKPEYVKYPGNARFAPLARNEQLAEMCDYAVVFWSGVDGGTLYTMRCLAKEEKEFTVVGTPLQK
jgi:predicted Rossmann fold nucleotide-binding protein DprA/Smf involved in DNA uptake